LIENIWLIIMLFKWLVSPKIVIQPQAMKDIRFLFFFFFGNSGCPGQFTHTTTNPQIYWTPCKPSRQIRHYGDDRRARWGSNPGDRGKETLSLPLGHKPRCILFLFFFFFFDLCGCLDQLARTTTNPTAHWTPCKPSRHVRHREDDRRTHENSNPETAEEDKPLPPPAKYPQCILFLFLFLYVLALKMACQNSIEIDGIWHCLSFPRILLIYSRLGISLIFFSLHFFLF
jgi:hypothetical protein